MRIAVMGTGNMGRAIINGLLNAYGTSIELICYDRISDASAGLPESVTIAPPTSWFTKPLDAILLAVKPSDVKSAVAECNAHSGSQKPLWISIAAGVSIEQIQSILQNARICRVMPNTPALIGKGISAYSLNEFARPDDSLLVEKILTACGKSVQVPEKQMNAVTGLSGSGPAYVYLFIESLIEGGITAGLSYATARELAVQTVIGAAHMVEKTGDSPSDLKLRVMSPGGTTVEGLSILEKHAFKFAVINAVKSASDKAAQLNK